MSPLTEPTKLTLAKTYVGIDDPDAANYIALVEAADTAAGSPGGLETATKVAIHSFVKGCKADGIWPAIKASCILAGARTTNGALIPLKGTAPTPINFDLVNNTDYNRKTGLKGNGSSKNLDTNYAIPASLQNNAHGSAYVSTAQTSFSRVVMGNANGTGFGFYPNDASRYDFACNISSFASVSSTGIGSSTGLIGVARSNSASFTSRVNKQEQSFASASTSPLLANVRLFSGVGGAFACNARLAFYSIGESLDLGLLDARVTDLITAIGVAF